MPKKTTDPAENRMRLVFLLLTGFSVLFQLFQIGGLRLQYAFLAPYTNFAFAGILCLAASFVFALLRRYLPALLFTAAGVFLLVGTGFAMVNPAANSEGQTVTGIPAGVLWKFFVPLFLLLIPAAILFAHALRRRRREEASRPYEKQF